MSERISHEMLMAFVDGELDEATAETVRRAISEDPVLAERSAAFGRSRDMVRKAFADTRNEPVPEALVASVLGRRPATPARSFGLGFMQAALPLAASIALLFGVGGYWYGQQAGEPAAGSDFAAMAAALGATESGEHSTIELDSAPADFAALETYEVADGICRTFEVAGEGRALRGVGCKRGADWRVELTVAHAGGGGGYAPASDGATAAIGAFLDALEAQPVE
jgi:anti-sigma factor RsiW